MTQKRTLRDVKLALAEKYERLARVAGGKPKQRHYLTKAVRYRRQVQQIDRMAAAPR
jgi:hypothetical protein